MYIVSHQAELYLPFHAVRCIFFFAVHVGRCKSIGSISVIRPRVNGKRRSRVSTKPQTECGKSELALAAHVRISDTVVRSCAPRFYFSDIHWGPPSGPVRALRASVMLKRTLRGDPIFRLRRRVSREQTLAFSAMYARYASVRGRISRSTETLLTLPRIESSESWLVIVQFLNFFFLKRVEGINECGGSSL